MLATIHLLFGATIGKVFSNIWIIIPLAFFSHYLLDFIPHYCPHAPRGWKKGGFKGCNKKDFFSKSITPFFGSILMITLLITSKENQLNILIGGTMGMMPDVLSYFAWKKDINWANKILPRPGNMFYNELQNKKGIMMQVLFFLIGLTLFLIK
jgi:hypothetical protein